MSRWRKGAGSRAAQQQRKAGTSKRDTHSKAGANMGTAQGGCRLHTAGLQQRIAARRAALVPAYPCSSSKSSCTGQGVGRRQD